MRHHLEGGGLLRATVLAGAAAVLLCAPVLTGCAPPHGETAPPGSTSPPSESASTAHRIPPSASPLPASEPLGIRIPAIEVDSELIDLGLRADRTMEVPADGRVAGWYTKAPTPGELGPAVIAAHVDWDGDPGVFYDLGDLRPGDEVFVRREDNTTAVFRVDRVDQYPKAEFPTGAVYGDIDHAGLRLITCGGAFDDQARSYEDNLVAYAHLVDAGQGYGLVP